MDNLSEEEQEALDLARAGDTDEREKIVGLGIGAVCYDGAIRALDELDEADEKEERRLLYHEPRLYESRESIPRPEHSAWNHLCHCNDHSDETWFTWVELPRQSFFNLCHVCRPIWEGSPIVPFRNDRADGRTGSPRPQDLARRQLDCPGTIGIALKFITSHSEVKDLATEFGVVIGIAQKYIAFGVSILKKALLNHEISRIVWQGDNEEYLREMSRLTRLYCPELNEWRILVVAFIDAVRFKDLNKWSQPDARREDQSNETKQTQRKCMLLSDPRGYIIGVALNLRGSWGDSKAGRIAGIYDLIEALLDGYHVAADTAYLGGVLGEKIVKILKEGQTIPDGLDDEDLETLEHAIIRVRKPGEWINRDFCKAFARLRSILGTDDDVNGDLMLVSVLVHNWRVSTCNRNQVKKFFQILSIQQQHRDAH